MFWSVIALISLIAWVYLVFLHEGFWRGEQRLRFQPPPAQWPARTAIIPARDEEATIAPVIAAHMKSAYPGNFHVILVDDQSSDATAKLAQDAAIKAKSESQSAHDFTIVSGTALPMGWSGKIWAMAQGIAKAEEIAPDTRYFLFTDADIAHAPTTLTRLVSKAKKGSFALTSLMARLDARGAWGALLIPAFIYFFQKLYPFKASNNLWRPTAAAAGGCMLVDKNALMKSGGLEAMKSELIDDCALAAQIKGAAARPIWIGLGDDEVVSLRDNRSFASIWNMVARTAFSELNHSWSRLIGAMAGMILVYFAGPISLITWPFHQNGFAGTIGTGAVTLMAISYIPTLKLYRQPLWRAVTLPIAAFFYVLMTVNSGLRYAKGSGGLWKGRTYASS